MSIFELVFRNRGGLWVAGLCTLFLAGASIAATAQLSAEQLRDRDSPKRLDAEFGRPADLRLAQAEDNHSAHHPGTPGSGGASAPQSNGTAAPGGGPPAPSSSGSSNPGMMGETGMMGEMMGRPRKEFYPSLMEMPSLTPEQRLTLESQARGRINSDIDGISAAEKNLRHAIAGGDIAAADQAAKQIRDSLNQVQSGVTALRALNEGKPPQQIAQSWFKSQMNLATPEQLHGNTDSLFGISWFHVITMALLAIFSAGMLIVYVQRMRRANALVDRLTRAPAPGPSSPPAAPASPARGATDIKAPIVPTRASVSGQPTYVGNGPLPSESGRRSAAAKPGGLWKGRLRVCAIYKETPSVKTFRLQDPAGGVIPFSFLPGQFLTYSAEIDGTRPCPPFVQRRPIAAPSVAGRSRCRALRDRH
jgi:hypothetical protein